jgi:molybdate transport system substrate-binding protein
MAALFRSAISTNVRGSARANAAKRDTVAVQRPEVLQGCAHHQVEGALKNGRLCGMSKESGVMLRSSRVKGYGLRACRNCLAVAAVAAIICSPNAASEGAPSQSSELRIFTTRSIATVLEKIGGDFERRTGRKLNLTTDVAARMVRRINANEPFDFLVAAPAHIDGLISAGKIIPETRTDLARSGIGVAVRAGASKPDVSSVDAFKRALLGARSIAYLKEGQSGVYVAGVLERLGLASALRSKLTLPETDIVSELVSRGEVELGIVVITQILTTRGVALAGPLPAELQSYITFTGGISAHSKSVEAAKELMAFLKSPAAISVMRSQGMEPAD